MSKLEPNTVNLFMEYFFPSLPAKSRIWIFQSNLPFKDEKAAMIKALMNGFLSKWQSHGKPMIAEYVLIRDHFIVVALNNESGCDVSGCGIDSLVNFIKELGNTTAIDFLNNANVAFLINKKVEIYSLNQIKKLIEDKIIGPDTAVFVNSITTLEELNSNWLMPVKDSWLRRYLKLIPSS